MLAEMLVTISEELLRVGTQRSQGTPAQTLRALVDWHVDFALRHKALIVVQDRDWESLPADAREQLRTLQRAYVDRWATQLQGLHSGVDLAAARAMAHAAFGLINSTPHSALVAEGHMRTLLTQMALRSLDVPD